MKSEPAGRKPAGSSFACDDGRCRKSRIDLKRDEIRLNRHRALALCLSMISSENRYSLFRIML
jgi:hypothetical protein